MFYKSTNLYFWRIFAKLKTNLLIIYCFWRNFSKFYNSSNYHKLPFTGKNHKMAHPISAHSYGSRAVFFPLQSWCTNYKLQHTLTVHNTNTWICPFCHLSLLINLLFHSLFISQNCSVFSIPSCPAFTFLHTKPLDNWFGCKILSLKAHNNNFC